MLMLKKANQSGKRSIKVNGKINIETHSYFENTVRENIIKESDLYLDFSKLNYISSIGIRSLIIINKQAKLNESKIYIIGATGDVKEVLQITGITNLIKCLDSFDDVT